MLAELIITAALVGFAPAVDELLAPLEAPSPAPTVESRPADGAQGGRGRRAGASRTFYVATNGSDAGPCTKARPCRTLNRGYKRAGPGDVVEVAEGEYPSQTIHSKAGAAPPNVVIQRAPGARVILGDEDATVECIEFEGARHVTVKGFKTPYTRVGGMQHQCGVTIGRSNAHHVVLRNIDAGMIWFGADHVRVYGGDFGPGIDENTKIEFATGHPPHDILIDGAVIHHGLSYQQHPECLALWGGKRITIRNTLFSNCEVFHLWIAAEEGSTISDILIENNRFTQPNGQIDVASTFKVGDKGGDLENVVIRRNRILVDELYVVQGYGDGGDGDVSIKRNRVHEPIELGSGQNCMRDATHRPRPGVVYRCKGNVRVS
ncbi:MAG TPA: hypothetical protein VHK22_05230 [Gaiellaceae bacterium]|nr:hypothetical protein [Gaiellaceae bacterium]